MRKLIMTGTAATMLGIRRQGFIANYVNKGKIEPVGQTEEGYYLYDPKEVKALAAARLKRLKDEEKKRARVDR